MDGIGMKTRTSWILASGLLAALPVFAAPPAAPQPQGINQVQPTNTVYAEIIRRSSGNPRSSFTVIDANRVAVNVTFTLDSHNNVIAMKVDRDASFVPSPGEAPITLTRSELARKGDPYWDRLYPSVVSAIRFSMLLMLT
jgi:hypothetical protein